MKNILIALLLVLLAVYLGVDFLNHNMSLSFSGDGDHWQWASSGADGLIAIPVLLLVGAILLFIFAGFAAFLLFIGGVVVLACLLPALVSLLPLLLMAYLIYLLVCKSKPQA